MLVRHVYLDEVVYTNEVVYKDDHGMVAIQASIVPSMVSCRSFRVLMKASFLHNLHLFKSQLKYHPIFSFVGAVCYC